MNIPDISLGFVVAYSAFIVYKAVAIVWRELTSPLQYLRGPSNFRTFLLGNVQQLFDRYSAADEWIATYGPTFKVNGPFNTSRLYTLDPKAQTHVLMNCDVYERPLMARQHLSRIVGPGLLVAEGENHKRQRKVMNPAFGPAQIRDLTPIFIETSIELRDKWLEQIPTDGNAPAPIEILSWLGRATLDIIGLAGFNYRFDALRNNEPNELNRAFSLIFEPGRHNHLLLLLKYLFPVLDPIKTASERVTENAQAVMTRISRELLSASKAAVLQAKKGAPEGWSNQTMKSRSLLSLLVRANTADGLPESPRLSDEDVLAQIPTFIVTGHETTSTATTWTLFSLSQYPEIQSALREELLSIPTENPSMDELNALPYLDRVVREALRLHSPVPLVARSAVVDDIIPLSQPVVDVNGVVHRSIEIRAGQIVMLPIASTNTFEPIWGADAHEFKPDRWLTPSKASAAIPGVWSNQLTFVGGSHACIGYRFSLVEMKALLFTLIRAFEFELAVPVSDIDKKSMIVQRPLLKNNPEAGNMLPMLVKSVKT